MNKKQLSYIYGLMITDGSLQKKNGIPVGLTLEISIKDRDLVEKLHNLIPYSSVYYRNRVTNFSDDYNSVIFYCGRRENFQPILDMGFPLEDKTNLAAPPITDYDEVSFWRGVIDGDGSLGFRKNGQAFLSLATKSEGLKQSFCLFLQKITGRKYNPKRNQRDGIYNIGCNTNSAKKVIKVLYEGIEENDIYLDRKYQKMKEVLQWQAE